MSPALAIIALTVGGVLLLGLLARSAGPMSLEQWAVGGRGFGGALVFLLMAGEIYTTFTFLGGSGWAYGRGGPAYYIVCYATLAYAMSYWLLPAIWRYARSHALLSQPDFFANKYDSPALGVLVACVGLVALVPYLVLQLTGLGIIVSAAADGAISATVAVWIGVAVLIAYVTVSGVRASAWTAAVKDVAILLIVVFLGLYLPLHLYGSFAAMFTAIDAAKPGFLALPAHGQSPVWFASTIVLTACGFFAWPHSFGSIYTAANERIFRRNAIMLPAYQLILAMVFFVGFAAILRVPGLTGSKVDLALLRLSIQTFPSWVVGIIGAAGVLTALVPGSVILVAGATLVANNLYRPWRGAASEREIALVARLVVPAIALIALYFTLNGGTTIVQLLLMGYAFVTQLFPAMLMSLSRRNPVTSWGAMAGIVVGVGTVAVMTARGLGVGNVAPFLPASLQDLNVGSVALGLNIGVTALVSAGRPSFLKKRSKKLLL
jgi:SSS family solute:Na+ symporter